MCLICEAALGLKKLLSPGIYHGMVRSTSNFPYFCLWSMMTECFLWSVLVHKDKYYDSISSLV